MLTYKPVLAYYDVTLKTKVSTDVCKDSLGEVLLQMHGNDWKPVDYAASSMILLVVSLHPSDPLSDTLFCDIVVNHEIIKRACLSQQRALEEMLHRLISFFTITRCVILICIFPLS